MALLFEVLFAAFVPPIIDRAALVVGADRSSVDVAIDGDHLAKILCTPTPLVYPVTVVVYGSACCGLGLIG